MNYQFSKNDIICILCCKTCFKVTCVRADVTVLSPYALRHSHAVHLLEAGINLKNVSDRLGHASVKITADTYLHKTKKMEFDLVSQSSEYMETH